MPFIRSMVIAGCFILITGCSGKDIRFIVTFAAIKDGEIVDLDFQVNAPVETHIPLPGDEVLIPEEKSTARGFTSKVFTVTKRRFLYDGVIGVAGAATLYLSQD